MNSRNRMELWTTVGQAFVLTAGFALVFSWDGEFALRALLSMILVLLALIYPMPDRLRNAVEQQVRELHKAHGLTQVMLAELRDAVPVKPENEDISSEEKLRKAENIAQRLETTRSEYDQSFNEAFQNERTLTRADRAEFLGDALGIVVYLAGLIGGAAFLGWLVSLAFSAMRILG